MSPSLGSTKRRIRLRWIFVVIYVVIGGVLLGNCFARSGRQNIAEGSQASGTSKKFELKLVGVARASLEELLLDFEDFLRQRGLSLWGKGHPTAQVVRHLAYENNGSYSTYSSYN
jgi:hypothetical protein